MYKYMATVVIRMQTYIIPFKFVQKATCAPCAASPVAKGQWLQEKQKGKETKKRLIERFKFLIIKIEISRSTK